MEYVYLVYTIFYKAKCYDVEIYSTKEKAIDAANQLLLKYRQEGYKITSVFATENTVFSNKFNDDDDCIQVTNEEYIDICYEKKLLR